MAKIKAFWLQYEQKIVLGVGFALVSAVSFGFGLFQGQKMSQKPLIIEKQAETPQEDQNLAEGENRASEAAGTAASKATQSSRNAPIASGKTACAYVGSKKSTKFYAPTCAWAKRIKPENLACYQSEQEALTQGKIKSDCK